MKKPSNQTSADRYQERALRLVVSQQSLIQAYARVICRDPSLAEDAAQEAALDIIAKAEQLPPPGAEIPWLKQVVRHKALHQLRKHKRQQPLDEGTLDSLAEELDHSLLNIEPMQRAMLICLNALSEQARRLLSDRYQSGMSAQDLAEKMQMHIGAVYSRIKRIKQVVRDCVAQRLARDTAP